MNIRSYHNIFISVCIYTGSTPSKSADSTDWQMLGGLIGGGVFLLIILAGLIVIFRYKPPDPGPDPQGSAIYACSYINMS